MTDAADEEALLRAVSHASLGLPLPRGTRLRRFKRVVGLLHRSTTRHQIAYNHAVIEMLRPMLPQLDALAIGREALSVALRSEIATLVDRLTALESSDAATTARIEVDAALLADVTNEVQRARARLASLEVDQRSARQRDLARRAVEQLHEGSHPDIGRDEAAVLRPSDELMFALEETFRGPFDEIRERLRTHLDVVAVASAVGPVIDLGCGRGEWLTLLAEAGIDGYGIDRNPLAVEHARARGVNVFEQELFGHLTKCADGSFGAVTAFHLIEHLEPGAVLRLFSEAVRVLRPGGVFVVETPNVVNLIVGASTFHLDPTHINPVHPNLLEFLFSAHGFADVAVRFLQPAERLPPPPAASPELAGAFDVLNGLMFGAQDVAVGGWRRDD